MINKNPYTGEMLYNDSLCYYDETDMYAERVGIFNVIDKKVIIKTVHFSDALIKDDLIVHPNNERWRGTISYNLRDSRWVLCYPEEDENVMMHVKQQLIKTRWNVHFLYMRDGKTCKTIYGYMFSTIEDF